MRAVVFDFDGTLTNEEQNVWKLLWEKCGDESGDKIRKNLYKLHRIDEKITRKQWFDATANYFRKKGLTKQEIIEISNKIELISGVKETIEALYMKGYELFIVSGCIKETILNVLGPLAQYFTDIQANKCVFDDKGNLSGFIPTRYDYEGKADYIELLKRKGFNAEDIVFMGNSDNDEWVHQTGCKTVCINPENTDTASGNWDRVFMNVTDLRQIFIKVNVKPNVAKDLGRE